MYTVRLRKWKHELVPRRSKLQCKHDLPDQRIWEKMEKIFQWKINYNWHCNYSLYCKKNVVKKQDKSSKDFLNQEDFCRRFLEIMKISQIFSLVFDITANGEWSL